MNVRATASSLSDDTQSDVSNAIAGAQDMLSQAASATGDKAAELRGRAIEQLKALQVRLKTAQDIAVEKSKAAAQATDEYVHDNPWRIVAGAGCLGVIIGLLIARR